MELLHVSQAGPPPEEVRAPGFREIAPYYDNPIPGALYLELQLR